MGPLTLDQTLFVVGLLLYHSKETKYSKTSKYLTLTTQFKVRRSSDREKFRVYYLDLKGIRVLSLGLRARPKELVKPLT